MASTVTSPAPAPAVEQFVQAVRAAQESGAGKLELRALVYRSLRDRHEQAGGAAQ